MTMAMTMTMANTGAARSSIILLIVVVLSTAKCANNVAAGVEEGRLLAASAKKGDHCDPSAGSDACSGDGAQVMECCRRRCTDVLTSRSNCGACGKRCGFGQLCCSGNCTTVAYDVNNCGRCGVVCAGGVRCEYGICGYA